MIRVVETSRDDERAALDDRREESLAQDTRDALTLTALRMLVKDLLISFHAGNEGVMNLLEHYVEMPHTDATEALAIYRHFCTQAEHVVEYLGVARKLQNLVDVPVPNLKHAPVSLPGALQEYAFEQNGIEYHTNNVGARTIRALKTIRDDDIEQWAGARHFQPASQLDPGAAAAEQAALDGRREGSLARDTRGAPYVCSSRFYLEDPLTLTALRMLVKHLLIQFQAGNEGEINLSEHYFEMLHTDATEALAISAPRPSTASNISASRASCSLLDVKVPNLKYVPVSLAGALQEYLDYSAFEQNRIEYHTNKDAVKRGRSGASPSINSFIYSLTYPTSK
ncbi:hypothetical protein C8R44DRAFT_895988 [Mycena epipterygia]|nr:hypothetical protein C8R44DRAFT_895988 [Mycena epipterygia]